MRRGTTLARLLALPMALSATLFLSNGEAQTTTGRSGPAKSASKQPAAGDRNSKDLFSEQECREYARTFTNALSSGNQAAVTDLFDWDALFGTALQGLALPENQRDQLMMGLKSSLNKETGISGQFVKNWKDGGKFEYLRNRQNHGRQVILMRMLQAGDSGGINYYEFVPRRSVDGKIRAVDLYVYLNAEFVSASIRRGVLPVVASLSRSFLDKLLTSERDYVRDLPKLPGIYALINEGKHQEALARINALGSETKKEKTILLVRLRAAQAIGEKEYTEVLEDFRKLYPDDPCIDILSIDYYTLKKDIPKAIVSIDRLDKAVGGDAYLQIARAGLSEINNDLTAALKFGSRAIEEDPTMLEAYWYVISVSMRARKYDETLATLKKQDQAFKMNYKDLKTLPDYAGFVKSPQYREWLKYLAQKGGGQNPAPAKKSRSSKSKRGSGN